MQSPFEYGKVSFKESFTNRTKDITKLCANYSNGIHTILISPRRWGKTSLVKHAAMQLTAKDATVKVCFVDMFSVRSEQEFYETLGREVLKATANKWEEWVELSKEFLQKLSPQLALSTVPGTAIDVSIKFTDIEKNVAELLDLAEHIAAKKKIRLVVCLDEFQNLSFFDNPLAFQKKLRAAWQHHRHVVYCLYGSKRHMMMELFEKQSNPFYKFGDVFYLDKISNKHWMEFIVKQFASTHKKIDESLAATLADTVQNHSYYVQQLAHELWVRTETVATTELLIAAIDDVITRNTILYQRDFEQLSKAQINFLRMLSDGVTAGFSAQKNIQQYNLGTSANVNRILSALEQKEIIDRVEGKLFLIDPVFGLWLKGVFKVE